VLKGPQRFTKNKQVVRDLQCEFILKHLAAKRGVLTYLGLPSSSLEDVCQWLPLLGRITAVERGLAIAPWRLQNELLANAFLHGIMSKLRLLRGDIGEVIITGKDDFGNSPEWPFDVVSLDYSGGLFYPDGHGFPRRLEALKQLFIKQAHAEAKEFILFLSFNLHRVDQGEVRECLKVIGRDLKRFGLSGDKVIDAYLTHEKDQPRLKLYVLHLINGLAVQANFDTTSESPIFYLGNKDVEMMAFRFYLKASSRTFAPRSPKERLNQIINRRMIEIVDGKQMPTNLKLPLIKAEVARAT
jgi:hypothetical protein